MGKKVSITVGIAVLLAVVLASCGGGSSVTKAEYVKQANALCQDWEREREEEFAKEIQREQGLKPTPQRKEEAAINVVLKPYERVTGKLAELDAPAEDEQKVEEIVGAMEAALSRVKANPRIVLKESPFIKANSLAESYGLTKCHT
jgi:hypothetical protein